MLYWPGTKTSFLGRKQAFVNQQDCDLLSRLHGTK
jgi:hypothetical protein